jgi:hypothetical protein
MDAYEQRLSRAEQYKSQFRSQITSVHLDYVMRNDIKTWNRMLSLAQQRQAHFYINNVKFGLFLSSLVLHWLR